MFMATVMQLDLDRHFPFWFDNACLNVVEFGGRVARVHALNDTCHLQTSPRHYSPEQEMALDVKVTGREPGPDNHSQREGAA